MLFAIKEEAMHVVIARLRPCWQLSRAKQKTKACKAMYLKQSCHKANPSSHTNSPEMLSPSTLSLISELVAV
jgi:hypothetical protein